MQQQEKLQRIRGLVERGGIGPDVQLAELDPEERQRKIEYMRRLRGHIQTKVRQRNSSWFGEHAPEPTKVLDEERIRRFTQVRDGLFGPLDELMRDQERLGRYRNGTLDERIEISKPVWDSVGRGNIGLLVSTAALGDNNTKPLIEFRNDHGVKADDEERDNWMFMSYGQVDEMTNRIANGLHEKAGIRKGEHVTVITEGASPEIFLSIIALQKLGAVAVMIDARDPSDKITRQIVGSDSEYAILQGLDDGRKRRNLLEGVRKAVEMKPSKRLRGVISASSQQIRSFSPESYESVEGVENRRLGEIIEGSSNKDRLSDMLKTRADETAFMLFTSGTTGGKKPVELSNQNIMCMLATNAMACGKRGSVMPAQFTQSHLMGLYAPFGIGLLDGVYTGRSRIVLYNNSLELRDHPLDYVEKGYDTIFAIPAFLRYGLETYGGLPLEVRAMLPFNNVMSGSARLESALREEFNYEFGTWVRNRLGMSEVGLGAIEMTPPKSLEQFSVGKPVIPVEIIDSDTGKQIPSDHRGTIMWSGPTVAKGYYIARNLQSAERRRISAANDHSFPRVHGHRRFVSGDVGYIDPSGGGLKIVGRVPPTVLKDQYGEQIDLLEIQANLEEHPRVRTACCVPRTQKGMAFDFRAVCVPEGIEQMGPDDYGVLREELGRIDRHLRPHSFEFRRQQDMPVTHKKTPDFETLHQQDREKLRVERVIMDTLEDMGLPMQDIEEERLPPGFKKLPRTLEDLNIPPEGYAIRIGEMADIILGRPWMIATAKRWWLHEYQEMYGEGGFEDRLISIYARKSLNLGEENARELQRRLKVD